MNDFPIISFCIPTYNRALYIKRCIESIIGYQGDDIEIIISDNCSTDNTTDIINSFKDTRIKYFKNSSNIGSFRNIRKIIDYTNGNYVFYLTDDDLLIPGAVDLLKSFILKNNSSIIRGDIIVHLEKSQKVYLYSSLSQTKGNNDLSFYEKAYIIRQSSVLSGICFKKSELNLSYYDQHIDLWYPSMLIVGSLSYNMGYIANPLVIHTWENEVFWGVDPKSKEIFFSEIKGIAILKDKIEEKVYKQLCKVYIINKMYLPDQLLEVFSGKEKFILRLNVFKKKIFKYLTRKISKYLK